ncbi:MAG: hypothetical protein FGM44_05745 [Limnohabitans sp.]|nr:hypothetical protein [Limnohabitans sp.]
MRQIDDATWETMKSIKAHSEFQAVQLAGHDRREALIHKAASEGLTPAEIEQARSLEALQRQEMDEAAERREQSED